MIVLEAHGISEIERLLLGSVSQAVAMQAKCSVEIVRPRFAGEDEDTASTTQAQWKQRHEKYET